MGRGNLRAGGGVAARLVIALSLVANGARPAAARAAALDDWLEEIRIVAKFGETLVSTYDLALAAAYERMRLGRPLTPPPEIEEYRHTLAALFSREVLMEAAERLRSSPPDPTLLAAETDRLRAAYGAGDDEAFWRATSIPISRLQEEIRRRLVVERYLQDVLLGGVRVSDAELREAYAEAATGFGNAPFESLQPQLRRLVTLERVRDELQRLRRRFLERNEVVILDPRFSREDVIRSPLVGFVGENDDTTGR